jgi:hypothetical protein
MTRTKTKTKTNTNTKTKTITKAITKTVAAAAALLAYIPVLTRATVLIWKMSLGQQRARFVFVNLNLKSPDPETVSDMIFGFPTLGNFY